MSFSKYLLSRHDVCKELVERLLNKYDYVSILGVQSDGKIIAVSSRMSQVSKSPEAECGFVCKIYNGKHYSEYSFSDINENNIDEIEKEIIAKVTLPSSLAERHVDSCVLKDEPLKKDFDRPTEGKEFNDEEILKKLTEFKDKIHAYSPKIVQAMARFTSREVNKMFISKNRDLTQHYTWFNCASVAVARDGNNMQNSFNSTGSNSMEKAFLDIENKLEEYSKLAVDLLDSTMIEPGEYDIITDSSITGLIAHEAFGHGVEMDMFVKNRALAKDYVGKYVASPLVNMHDGASSYLSAGSYFFDDDGILAHDTLIIKDGILVTGISDAISAMQLGTEPTGNGRRESYKRKAYTRMTNTFFAPGKDKLDDMIKSIKHGYYLCQTNNGMEDPKNWNIQCVCQFGREIKDGKFTGKIVAPVVMSGYVPDLLKSISMVSSDLEVVGSGYCGKGHKEWVYVADGGPCLKARCKLG